MQAVVWGAGKIGRGFVADILMEGGNSVVFVDRDRQLVDLLRQRGGYTIWQGRPDGITSKYAAGPFSARHTDEDLSDLFLAEDLFIDIAVFKQDLPSAADMLVPYLKLRSENRPDSVTNIVTNVNMVSPEKALRGMLEERGAGDEGLLSYIVRNTAVSGMFMVCISPDATEEMKKADPLAVYNNAFFEQAVDARVLKGNIPRAPRLRLSDELEREEARKLWTVNMAHCALAYLGTPRGFTTGYEAVRDGGIRETTRCALGEASFALEKEYDFTEGDMGAWTATVFELLDNPYITDPLSRLGADPIRKLGANDRLLTPARTCLKYGRRPEALAKVIRFGYAFSGGDPSSVRLREMLREKGLTETMRTVSSLEGDGELTKMITEVDV